MDVASYSARTCAVLGPWNSLIVMLMRGLDWFFRSRENGRITIGQWPNLPLWLFGVASVTAWIADDGPVGRWSHIAANVFLTWWAADEVLRGVNPWRRCLGAGVLAWLAWSWIAR